MAAGPWTFYLKAKGHIGDGTINLLTDTFRMALYTSASNVESVATLSTFGAVTGEVIEANGYMSSGKVLPARTWATGASAGEMRFDSSALVWSAAGGNIANVKYAVIWKEGVSALARKLLFYSKLSTGQFNVTTGNSLTITPSSNGYFELN